MNCSELFFSLETLIVNPIKVLLGRPGGV